MHVKLRGHSFYYRPPTPLYLMVSEILHLFVYHTIVFFFKNKTSIQPLQKEQLKTFICIIRTVLKYMCEQVMGESDLVKERAFF